jgi:metal-responsive CopG/Arc/MetJ family transcriptional regulator
MSRPAKLSEDAYLRITYEMGQWLDEIARTSGAKGRSAAARALLQTLMDEDTAAHAEPPELRVVT